MKIRTNFVSNSSSSSFIVGYGVINPKKRRKCIEYCTRYLGSLGNFYNHWYTCKVKELIRDNRFKIGFIDYKLPINKFDPEDNVLLIQIENNEGDGEIFYNEAEWNKGNHNSGYEKASKKSFYSQNQQKIIEILESKEFFVKNKPSSFQIGAARND